MSWWSGRKTGLAGLPVEGRLPGFDGATGWLNSRAARQRTALRGKVVLVDFWTYTCINWLRTLAYVRAWAEKYGDEGWSSSASTRRSSRSSATPTTSAGPRRT